jgi:hypothetical protein
MQISGLQERSLIRCTSDRIRTSATYYRITRLFCSVQNPGSDRVEDR